MYPTSFPGLGHGRRAVSGAGSVTAADVGLILDCSGTFALTFAAAATLGNQFQVAFYVSSGTVTLTGNGAETIQSPTGSANTFVLTAGQGAYVSCDGTGLKIVLGVGLAPAPATTIITDTIQAATTAGIVLKNSSGTQVASFGLTGTGVIFAGAVTANGGTVQIGTADINGGAIDGTAIGASSASTVRATTLTATGLTSGRVPVVSTSGLITDYAGLTFTTGTNEELFVGDGSGEANVYVNGGAGSNRNFRFRTNGTNRWSFYVTSTAESGSDAGSNWSVRAFTDAGSTIDDPISIVRASGGAITFARPTTQATNWSQTGATTFSTGTGNVSLNGAVTCSSTLMVGAGPLTTNAIAQVALADGQSLKLSGPNSAGNTFDLRFSFGASDTAATNWIRNTRTTSTKGSMSFWTDSTLRMTIADTGGITFASAVTCASTLTVTGALKLGNAAVAATPTPTHTITIQDSTGTTYRIPCVV